MDEKITVGQGRYTVELHPNKHYPRVVLYQVRWERDRTDPDGYELTYDDNLSHDENEQALGSDAVCLRMEDIDAFIVKLVSLRAQMEE